MSAILNCLLMCCPCLKTKPSKEKTKNKTNQKEREKNSGSPKKLEITDSTKGFVKKYKIPTEFHTYDECIKDQNLEIQDQIGSGAFATVYRVLNTKTNKLMACKAFKVDDNASNKETYDGFLGELEIMRKIGDHENIVTVVSSFAIIDSAKKCEKYYIVMELADGGTVLDSMAVKSHTKDSKFRRFPEKTAKDYFIQIVLGLNYLHSKLIAHKDLKLQNILIFNKEDGSKCLKITDFGLSRIRLVKGEGDHVLQVQKERSGVGTPEYMSPQVFKLFVYCQYGVRVAKLKEYNPIKADMWALGVCLFIMVNALFPFGAKSDTPTEMTKMWDNMMHKRFRMKYPDDYADECYDVIKHLLEPNPETRLTMDALLQHKWIQPDRVIDDNKNI